jgi:hypothetical protein
VTAAERADPAIIADLLNTGADLVTMDAARPLVRDGAIAVRAGQIGWIGTAAEARRRVEAARTLDATGRIAMPGLVDAHFHTGQQLLRGKIIELAKRRQLRLPIWRNYLIPFESVLTEELHRGHRLQLRLPGHSARRGHSRNPAGPDRLGRGRGGRGPVPGLARGVVRDRRDPARQRRPGVRPLTARRPERSIDPPVIVESVAGSDLGGELRQELGYVCSGTAIRRGDRSG